MKDKITYNRVPCFINVDGKAYEVSLAELTEYQRNKLIPLRLKEQIKCDTCGGDGWIDTYNCKAKTQEIQRCDECKMFASDDEARDFVTNKNK